MEARRYRIDPRIHPSETEFVRRHLDANGWTPTEGDDWNLYWSDALHDLDVFAALDDDRMVNHFAGISPLHFKDELAHFVRAAGHRFHPTTFSMPWERDDLLKTMEAEPDAFWLRKQKRALGGEGMAILTDDIPPPTDEKWLVQRYMADPLLLPHRPYKSVLRFYVVVTSLDPLTAFVHPNGPAKFTSRPFDLGPDGVRDMVRHLTNPAIQRLNTDVADPIRGMDHDGYRALLRDNGIDDAAVVRSIHHMLAETLVALHAPVLELSRAWSPRLDRSFELLGFDLMLDAELRPWLLECNISPALGARGTPGTPTREAQVRAKDPMLGDMLRLVGLTAGTHRFEPLVRASSDPPASPRTRTRGA